MSVPMPPNSLLNSVEEKLVALVSGLGSVPGQDALVLITAQLLTPCATQGLLPTLAGPQCPDL